MRSGIARHVLLTQLRGLPRLPEPLLRAAGGYAADDLDIAVALAARLDLPADLRADRGADRRPEVREVFACRSDIDTGELTGLLADESRAAVLAAVAGSLAHDDPVAAALLWARLLERPTKTLAAALLPGVASAVRPVTSRPRAVPVPPSEVLVALVAAFGVKANGARSLTSDLERVGSWLADGGDPAAAEALARRSDTPLELRAKLAGRPHLSAGARRALLEEVWLAPVLAAVQRQTPVRAAGATLGDLPMYLPDRRDVFAAVLEQSDVQPDVVEHARALLTAHNRTLPPAWLRFWAARLASAAPAPCRECRPDGVPLPTWDRAVPTGPRPAGGRWAPGAPDADAPVTGEDLAPATSDTTVATDAADPDDPDDLDALDDYDLAHRIATLPADRLPDAVTLAAARESTVVAGALLDRPEVTEADAVWLLSFDWYAGAAEVLVRHVGERRGQPLFAITAAGRACAEVVGAYGTAMFAPPGAADPKLAGGLALAAAVGSVTAGRPAPGWGHWLNARGQIDPKRVADLAALAGRRDTPDAVLLALPWRLVADLVRGAAPYRPWNQQHSGRLRQVLTAGMTAELGADSATWEAFSALADDWSGSVAELLAMARATTA